MKRVLALMIIIFLTCSNLVFAEDLQKASTDIGLLKALKIVSDKDKNLQEQFITRGDAAVFIARMLAMELHENSKNTSRFIDLQDGTVLCDAVCKLTDCGVINGYDTTQFLPQQYITKAEAMYMFLYGLGYKNYLTNLNDYSANNISLAKSIGIYVEDNRSNNAPILTDTFLKIMKKTLEAKMFILTEVKFGQGKYETSKNETILSRYYNVKKSEGIVEANDLFNIGVGSKTAKDTIQINSAVYTDTFHTPIDMAGKRVNYYVKDEDVLVYIEENAKNEVITIDAVDILDFNDGTYKYQTKSGTKSIEFSYKDKPIIYNYQLMMDYQEKYMLPKGGYIQMIDNNNDGIYDVMYIMNYINYYVNGTEQNGQNLYVYDENALQNKVLIINLQENGGTVLLDDSMNEIQPGVIKKGCIISAFGKEAEQGYIANLVILSKESLIGVVSEMNNKIEGEQETVYEILINNVLYDIYGNLNNDKIEVNKSYRFLFDYKKKIAAVLPDQENSTMAVGYLVDAKYTEIEDALQLKIFTEFGKMHIYKCKSKISVYGNSGSIAARQLFQDLGGETVNNGLIGYRVNEDGKIYEMSFATDWTLRDTNAELFTMFRNQSLYYIGGSTKSFYNRYTVSDNAIVFQIPSDGSPENYLVKKTSGLEHAQTYLADGYMFHQDSALLDVVVVHTNTANNTTIADDSAGYSISVVKSVNPAINGDDEAVHRITLIGKYGEQTYYTKDNSIASMASINGREGIIQEGDVIRYALNYKNEIDYIRIIYDASEDAFSSLTQFLTGFGNKSRPVLGRVLNFSGNTLQMFDNTIDCSSPDFANTLSGSQIETYPIRNAPIVIYDKEARRGCRVYTGKATDIMTYRMARDKCSLILADSYEGSPKIFVVFK